MQQQLYQTLEALDQFDIVQEWPFLNKFLTSKSNFSADEDDDQASLDSFFRECLLKLKEYRETISSQEAEIKSVSHELISQKEDNNHLAEANHSLMEKIAESNRFMDEIEVAATSLRNENTSLMDENTKMKTALEKFEKQNLDSSFASPIGKISKDLSENNILEDAPHRDQELKDLKDTVQKQNSAINILMQEIEELADFKEQHENLIADIEDLEAIKQENIKLHEDLALLSEEYQTLVDKVAHNSAYALKHSRSVGSEDIKHDQETDWHSLNSKEDGSINKNTLLNRASLTISPSSESTGPKRSSLLAEAILLTSNESQKAKNEVDDHTSGRKASNNESQSLTEVDATKLASLDKPKSRNFTENVDAKKLGPDFENLDSKALTADKMVDSSPIRPLGSQKNKSEQRDLRVNNSSIERSNGKNENTCFENMLTWEEGDFPQLVSPNAVCRSNVNWEPQDKNLMAKASRNVSKIINSINKENDSKILNTDKSPIVAAATAVSALAQSKFRSNNPYYKPRRVERWQRDWYPTEKVWVKKGKETKTQEIQTEPEPKPVKKCKSRTVQTEVEQNPAKQCKTRAIQTDTEPEIIVSVRNRGIQTEPVQILSSSELSKASTKDVKKTSRFGIWILRITPVLAIAVIALLVFFYKKIIQLLNLSNQGEL